MIIELIIALIVGILIGTLTGLAPGIHINLVAAFLLASLSQFQSVPLIALAVFIVSMSITHTFIDFIPSIFLGAPEEDNFLSVLPGHQLLKQGLGHKAALSTFLGALTGIFISLIILLPFIYLLPLVFSAIKLIIPFILIFASLYLIFREERILPSIIIFILSGILGILTFNLPVKEPLLPLLTGLFGASSLIISIKQKTTINPQKITKLRESLLARKEFIKTSLTAMFVAPLCSFLPGIGSGHAALIGSEIKETNHNSFLFMIGSINIIVMSLSFATAYSISKARTGSAVAVQSLLKTISPYDLAIIFIAILISGLLAFFLAILLSRIACKYISKINYQIISLVTLLILLNVVFIFSNPLGFLIFLTSSFLGIYTILSNSRRINMMGCLLIPSISYYLIS